MRLPPSMREKMLRKLESSLGQSLEDTRQVALVLLESIEQHELNMHDSEAEYRKRVHAFISQIASGLFAMSIEERRRLLTETAPSISIHSLLKECVKVLEKNRGIWTTVTNHHTALKDSEGELWSEVIASAGGLDSYARAATLMGEKEWVKTGHRWIEDILWSYWKDNLALSSWRRLRMKQKEREDEEGVEWVEEVEEEVKGLLSPLLSSEQRINLLDVGSCFNPHVDNPALEVTALDLEPNCDSVYTADFLTLEVGDSVTMVPREKADLEESGDLTSINRDQVLTSLPRHLYHAVTMSLVLNYLPSAVEREAMVVKARELLVHSSPGEPHSVGMLVIAEKASIFPSSGSQGHLYSRFVQTWKNAMRRIGFAVVRYKVLLCGDKRMHLMACRVIDQEATMANHSSKGRLVIKADFAGQEEMMQNELCEVPTTRRKRGNGNNVQIGPKFT